MVHNCTLFVVFLLVLVFSDQVEGWSTHNFFLQTRAKLTFRNTFTVAMISRAETLCRFLARVSMLEHTVAKVTRPYVRPSVSHTREPRPNGSRHQNTFHRALSLEVHLKQVCKREVSPNNSKNLTNNL